MDNKIVLSKCCPITGKFTEVVVNEQDYHRWVNGELTQKAFPYLSAEKREVLISGICPEKQKELFY